MASARRPGSTATRTPSAPAPTAASVIALLQQRATKHTLVGMARYALPSERAFGVSMSDLKQLAREVGPSHELAAALWKSGWYEARMLATLIDDPTRVTAAQMDRWCREFDNWGICDTACFALFDRTKDAWKMVARWDRHPGEFQRRTTYALLWSLSVHDKTAADARFLAGLKLIERAATDERHFVKKAVNMALRAIGKRNRRLNEAAVAVSRRLGASGDPTARWVGSNALRELTGASVQRRVGTS